MATLAEAAPPPGIDPALAIDFDYYSDRRYRDAGGIPQAMAQLRDEAPDAFWSTALGGYWVVQGHDAIVDAAARTDLFSSGYMRIPARPDLPEPPLNIPLQLDPPNHAAYRAPLNNVFTPTQMYRRVGQIRTLERLDLSHTRVTDLGFTHLKALTKVTHLNLYYAELTGDGALAVVKNWPKLQWLNLRGTKLTDTGLAHLANHPELAWIDAGYAEMTDNGVEFFATMPKLHTLAFGGNKMTDVGLTPLRLIAGLKVLDLGGLQRTDSGLWQVTVTDRGAETLSGMAQLEILSLRNSKITDVGVDHLVKLKNLKRLDVVNTSLTDAGIARLRAALPNCDLRSGKVNQVRR